MRLRSARDLALQILLSQVTDHGSYRALRRLLLRDGAPSAVILIKALITCLPGGKVEPELPADDAGQKAGTECCCHPVALMIVAIVVPWDPCSRSGSVC